jgi:hypothetical protein
VSVELNVLVLMKGEERYIYVYDDESRVKLLDLFRDQAADDRYSLNGFDAATLSQKAREQGRSAPTPTSSPRF